MKTKTGIKAAAWGLAILINAVIVFAYFGLVGLDGGYHTQIEKGDEYVAAGEYEKAVKAYTKAMSIAPTTSTGYIKAAETYERLQLPDKAIETMEKYVATSPRSLESFEYLLSLYEEHDSALEKRIAVLDQAAVLFDDAGYATRSGELKLLLSAVEAPAVTLAAGSYKDAQTVKISNLDAGDTVYYTTNGADPDTACSKYNPEKGISLKKGATTLKLLRCDAEGHTSDVVSLAYYIGDRLSGTALEGLTSQSGNGIVTGARTLYLGTETVYSAKGGLFSTTRGMLTDDAAESLNYSNGYIYYVNTSDGDTLYRIDALGQNREQILKVKCGMVHIAGETIVFENKSDGSALYTASLTGGSQTKLTNDRVSMFTVFKGYIYCRNDSDSGALYRYSLDGAESEALVDARVSCINISDNFVYYMNMNDDGKIYRIAPDGGDASQVCPVGVSEFTLSGETIFYRGVAEKGIFRCGLMGEDTMQLTGDDGAKLSVAGNRLYYVNYSDGSALYSIGINGGAGAPVA
ncbi:MAG TPA: DUF5050 domain-containing protein [Candidatus Acidoferrum sp.]|nr:DUF5050 domain-containing protein [Candidatus Acidoferrum sp.]